MTSGEFADVTLVTDDKQQIRAHRNILSILVLVVLFSRIFCNSTATTHIQLFTLEEFSTLRWSP